MHAHSLYARSCEFAKRDSQWRKPGLSTRMHWFALTTKPRHEMAVVKQLTAKSIEACVPVYRQRRRWSDRTKIIESPLFPRYVFCRFQFEDRLKVLRTF